MKKTPVAARGGWPKREREAIALRLDPALAQWFSDAAKEQTRSRNQLIEMSLQVIRNVIVQSEAWERQGLSPIYAVDAVGSTFVGEFIRLGLANKFIHEAWKFHQEDQAAKLADAEGGKANARRHST